MSAVVAFAGRRLLAAGHRLAAYAVVPLAWVAQELARGTTPFGGFPWARLAFSQADSPLARIAAYLGAPGVTLAVAVVGTGPARRRDRDPAAPDDAASSLGPRRRRRSSRRCPPRSGCRPNGTRVTVALVQGDVPQAGLDFNAQRRAVLDNHVRGTLAAGRRGTCPTSASSSGRRTPPTSTRCATPTRRPRSSRRSRPSGRPSSSAPSSTSPPRRSPTPRCSTARPAWPPEAYVKLHPVPFAEYIPYRSFFRLFSNKVDLVRADFVAGHSIGGFKVSSSRGHLLGAPDDLLRGGLRRPRPQRRDLAGTPAEHPRRPDQQRDLRLHRRVGAAVRHLPDPRDRARPVRRPRLDGRGERLHRPGRLRLGRDPPVHRRPRSSGTRWSAPAETVSDRLGVIPEVVLCAALLVLVAAAHADLGRRTRVETSRAHAEQGRHSLPDRQRPTTRPRPCAAHPGRRAHPDVQRAGQPRTASSSGCGPRCPRSTSSSSTTARPTARACWPTRSRPRIPRSTSSTGRGSRASAPPTSRASSGRSTSGYDAVVEMDADGSHQPEHLPGPARRGRARPTSSSAPGGSAAAPSSTGPLTARPSAWAATSTRRSCSACRSTTRRPGSGSTGPTRCAGSGSGDVASQGYCFQVDLTWRAIRRGLTVVEVPITFVEREVGDSKMSRDIMLESLRRITTWGVGYRGGQARSAVSRLAHREPRWHRL